MRGQLRIGLLSLLLAAACSQAGEAPRSAAAPAAATQKAIFAGGCFWCVESDFEKLPGVISAVSGYTGGHTQNVKYEDTHDGSTGHTEAVELTFDPGQVSYAQLVEYFFHHHDPFDGDGQFCDQGSQYRPGIFYLDDEQKKIAQATRDAVQKNFKQPILTEITQATRFWTGEAYHQDYYKNNPIRYRYYRSGCGRDEQVEAIWKGVAGAQK